MVAEPYVQFRISAGWLSSFDSTGTPTYLGTAYAGNGACVNDASMTWVKEHGPLPVGRYFIGAPQDRPGSVGVFALPLEPDPANDMMGRGSFWIHGDNPAMDHSASDGCVVAARAIREICAKFPTLVVTP